MKKFGQRLMELRDAAGLTQEALADELGVKQPQISRIQKGTAKITGELLDRLCKALGLGGRWGLVGGTELAHLDTGRGLVSVTGAPGITYLAYFASGLTGLSDEERDLVFQEAALVRTVCQEHRIFLYEPCNYTDPNNNPEIPAEEVYATDRAQVSESDFVILYCRYPSFGAGQEIEIATAAGIFIIALVPEGMKVSRMVLGCYAPLVEVKYDSHPVLESKLREILPRVINEHVARRARIDDSKLGGRVAELRKQQGLDRDTVAHLTGTTEQAISQLEESSCLLQNPSLSTLRRLAQVLKTTVSYLVDDVTPLPEQEDEVLARSKAALDMYARRVDLPLPQAQQLWTTYVGEYGVDRRMVAEARTEPLSPEDWERRHRPRRVVESGSLFDDQEDDE